MARQQSLRKRRSQNSPSADDSKLFETSDDSQDDLPGRIYRHKIIGPTHSAQEHSVTLGVHTWWKYERDCRPLSRSCSVAAEVGAKSTGAVQVGSNPSQLQYLTLTMRKTGAHCTSVTDQSRSEQGQSGRCFELLRKRHETLKGSF